MRKPKLGEINHSKEVVYGVDKNLGFGIPGFDFWLHHALA